MTESYSDDNDKSILQKILESLVRDPDEIKKETQALHSRFREQYGSRKTENEIADIVTDKIISKFSNRAALAGGVTALPSIIPGSGTAVAFAGGIGADTALLLKYQIEMVMAIATVYGHDIREEDEKRCCFIIAGLGATIKKGGQSVGSKAFVKMVRENLKGPALQAVKQVFKKAGITFTRKGLQKAIPFGVGVILGVTVNKGLTWFVGRQAKSFYRTEHNNNDGAPPSVPIDA